MRICDIKDCNNKHIAKGYCWKHYNWHVRHTDRDYSRIGLSDNEVFDLNTELIPFSTCWWWTGWVGKTGYGRFKRILAHRFSYTRHKGDIPRGMIVCHSCDNPGCVNPDHLWAGSHNDNCMDKISKGRHAAKLTREKVIEMRELYKTKKYTQTEIGVMFGVTQLSAHNAIKGKTWRHID